MNSDLDFKAAKIEKDAESKATGFFKSNTKSGQLYEEAAEMYKKAGNSLN